MNPNLWIFDLDGTLADDSNRHEWVYQGGDPTSVLEDPPIAATLGIARGVSRKPNTTTVFLTGRPEHLWDVTYQWLVGHGISVLGPHSPSRGPKRGWLKCRPGWCRDGNDITRWKVGVILKLARQPNPRYDSVTVFENKVDTLEELQRQWNDSMPDLVLNLVTPELKLVSFNNPTPVSASLVRFAATVEEVRRNLDSAGLFDADADYNGMLGKAVMDLFKTWRTQGHSGMSAELTLELFTKVVRGHPLTSKFWDERRDELLKWAREMSPDGGLDEAWFVNECLGPRPRAAAPARAPTREAAPEEQAAVVIVENATGQILMLQRGSTAPWMPNKWNLPGGVVDPGEKPLNAAIREAKEEASIRVSNLKLVMVDRSLGYPIFIYHTRMFSGTPRIDWESKAFKWVDKPKVLSMTIVPGIGKGLARVVKAMPAPAGSNKSKTGLNDRDLVNFNILMNRLAEPGWKKLLDRGWDSKFDLLDAAQEWVPGRKRRRQFRSAIDELWKA